MRWHRACTDPRRPVAGTAATFAIGLFGGLTDKALGTFTGPLKAALGRAQDHDVVPLRPRLREVARQHVCEAVARRTTSRSRSTINNALLYGNGASEVAAQSGHDLHWFISPPSSFQKQVVPVTDLVQEVRRSSADDEGRQEEHLQPEDEAVLRVPRDICARPCPVSAQLPAGSRREPELLGGPGGAKLKANGHPSASGCRPRSTRTCSSRRSSTATAASSRTRRTAS